MEAMQEDSNSSACVGIPNTNRKTFCGMARSADRAIANLTAALTAAFEGEDVVMMISGDNGGNVDSAGNNCPDEKKFCMRGKKVRASLVSPPPLTAPPRCRRHSGKVVSGIMHSFAPRGGQYIATGV